jgi:hypothetical protein
MHDPAWKRRYRVRAGVEGTLSQGVRAFGMRRMYRPRFLGHRAEAYAARAAG